MIAADQNYHKLESVWDSAWELLQFGQSHSEDPFHRPVVCTQGAWPDPRVVILRAVDFHDRLLVCHSDARAKKVQQLKQDDRLSWLFWHEGLGIQIRAYGKGKLHFKDEVADKAWGSLHLGSRKNYASHQTPGTVIDSFEQGITAYESGQYSDLHISESWRPYFCVIKCEILRLEWFLLRKDAFQRAQFSWENGQLTSQWLIP